MKEPLIDKIERLVFGASAREAVELRLKLAERRVEQLEQRLAAALDPDPARQCEACGGDGYVLADGGPDEQPCEACGGSGLKAEA